MFQEHVADSILVYYIKVSRTVLRIDQQDVDKYITQAVAREWVKCYAPVILNSSWR